MRLIDAEPLESLLLEMAAQCSNDYGSLAGAIAGCLQLVQTQPAILPPPNPPLTLEQLRTMTAPPSNPPLILEELREMDGELVWIQRTDSGPSRWAIMGDMKSPYGVYFGTAAGGLRLPYDDYGKTWLAYRRKPEEGTA